MNKAERIYLALLAVTRIILFFAIPLAAILLAFLALPGCGGSDPSPRGSFYIDREAIEEINYNPDATRIDLVGGSRVVIEVCCGWVDCKDGGCAVEVW